MRSLATTIVGVRKALRCCIRDSGGEDNAAPDYPPSNVLLQSRRAHLRVDKHIVCSVRQYRVNERHPHEERNQDGGGDLVLPKEFLDSHEAAEQSKTDDDGAKDCNPP